MTVTPETLERAGGRLAHHLTGLLTAVREGLGSLQAAPVQVTRWRRAAALLDQDQRAVSQALEVLQQTHTSDTLIAQAERLRFLARQMDGYNVDFAGEALGKRMMTERRLLVLVASQIVAAASGSPASGL